MGRSLFIIGFMMSFSLEYGQAKMELEMVDIPQNPYVQVAQQPIFQAPQDWGVVLYPMNN